MRYRHIIADTNERTRQGGGYRVSLGHRPTVTRPNRLAAGVQLNTNRQEVQRGKPPKTDILPLIVWGTFDALRGLNWMQKRHKVCPCCGSKTGKLELTSSGRMRLRAARKRKAWRDHE